MQPAKYSFVCTIRGAFEVAYVLDLSIVGVRVGIFIKLILRD